ncbi:MAG: DegT/DnrJ/EryC1/StrS family aminotransferase [Planctomycetaceae bacterium]|nr:DegT/DnrJ/EryC1/StrS family aminotransferase [Planctomycetaceae bacterium]
MMNQNSIFSRREFMNQTGKLGLMAAMTAYAPTVLVASGQSDGKAAILGGTPVSRANFSGWPVLEGTEVEYLTDVVSSGRWCRLSGDFYVERFEQEYAEMCGAKHCVATNGGTTALVASLGALGAGPGDEVITSPYTFIATFNSILSHYALPVPADVDLESFQIDPKKMDTLCTDNTICLLPVHIGGYPADMDGIMAIGKRRNIPVIEDACQGHLGKWRDKYLGTVGLAGCFSFQVSKNLNCGEGGAVLTDDEVFAQKVYMSHHVNATKGSYTRDFDFDDCRGSNFRMTEFQGAVLCSQIKLIEEYAQQRQENGIYLNQLLSEIPGIYPAKFYPNATQGAWHLYMYRIVEEEFGLNKHQFARAMGAEGIGTGGGYGYINWVEYIRKIFACRAGSRVYSKKTMDDYAERVGTLPMFHRLYTQALWLFQQMMIGPRSNMDIIAEAARRIHKNAAEIAKL